MDKKTEIDDYLHAYLNRSLDALRSIPLERIAQVIDLLDDALRRGRRIFICGNGGSAATASHFANDLGKGASVGRQLRFKVTALTDSVPWMTALANDLDYSRVFVEQLRNLAESGDVLIAFSGSGNSPNVIEAVEWAAQAGLRTVGLCGSPGGRLADLAEFAVPVASGHMGYIEDGHFLMQHLIAYYFMEHGPTGRD